MKKFELRKYLDIFKQIMPISIVRRHQNFVPTLQKEVSTTYRRKKYIFKMWRFKGFLRP